ncbi:MAG: aminotransferase class V-fold PLP-dependent enzyme [Candidatus Heimdallarchaeota archaeon]|nr:aminotransferase class V-fold PLP-dependent enzyme [Candidatus Heimdallarchaeota archaeon]MCK5143018.1 aminotransferase class V-fold PLP-dependent enzyme [Candidatus Heimdallarchaeota archaeon]
MMFNEELIDQIRKAFPRAAADFNGKKRAFFDNGTATLVLRQAAQAENEARINWSANVGGIFDESREASEIILAGRQAAADFLNTPDPSTIVSGESSTSLLFNLSYAMSKKLTGRENVVTTDYEHYTNIDPWVELNKRGKVKQVRFAKLNMDEGTLDMDHLQELIDTNTKIVTVTAASNMLGTKSPLEEIGKLAREVGAFFVVDAVHHIPHGPTDVQSLDCDFLVFSGYKLFTSHGSFLYGKKEHLEDLQPFKVRTAPKTSPGKFEWGTRNQATFAAFSGVIDHFLWLSKEVQSKYENEFSNFDENKRALKIAMDAIEQYETEFSKAILTGFDDIPGLLDMPKITVYGLTDLNRLDERDPTFSFEVENIPEEEVVNRLWKEGGIAARAGHYYSYAQDIYNKQKIIRISLVHYNTIEEIKLFLKTLDSICKSR